MPSPSSFGVHADSLPIGMIVRSTDDIDYIVAHDRTWRIYQVPEIIIVKALNNPRLQSHQSLSPPPTEYPIVHFSDYFEQLEHQEAERRLQEQDSYIAARAALLQPQKRPRGRPRKHPLPPSPNTNSLNSYNLFMREEMKKYAHITDTRERMVKVGEAWQQHKKTTKNV